MKTMIHQAKTRGHSNYGWLDTHYTFSFANYYDPGRIHFGALRVLNDDHIAGGGGFDLHPHDNMEIITIVLNGELEHKDSMGNTGTIHRDEVQVMSAGTGIRHSEDNKHAEMPLELLQIWVFPEKKNITPRYEQRDFSPGERINNWQMLVSPDQGQGLTIQQDACFSRISLGKKLTADYLLRDPAHGVYLFLIEGSVEISGIRLDKRDGIEISNSASVSMKALADSDILLMEIPMTFSDFIE